MKKLTGIILTLVMMMSMVVGASAAVPENGLITITGVNEGEMYTGYKIFDAEYDKSNTDNVTYTIAKDAGKILTLVKNYTYKDTAVFTLTERVSDGAYVVEAADIFTNAANADDAAKNFAEYLSANLDIIELPAEVLAEGKNAAYDVISEDNYQSSITDYQVQKNVTEKVLTGRNTISWQNLSYGYWFVKTTTGTVCTLTTAKPSVTVADKNPDTTIDKKVKENSNGSWKDDFNTAEIGETVAYHTTINAKVGAVNYKLYDSMTDGLTLNRDSIKVFIDTNGNGEYDSGETVLSAKESAEDNEYDYEVLFDVTHQKKNGERVECDFMIAFNNKYLKTITSDTKIVAAYTATVNENAKIKDYDDASDDCEHNDTGLWFGRNSETEWDKVETHIFFFDLVKIDTAGIYLEGAQFELYSDEECTKKVPLTEKADGIYRIATERQQKEEDFVSAVINAGHAKITGLDNNTSYYLKEVKAPDGYNMIKGIIEVAIDDDSNGFVQDYTPETDPWTEDMGGVGVVNKTGTELPSTGGMGTTIFYTLGTALVLGTGIVLVTRKRMSKEQ